nr:MAG TPA_asm: hypothetical protein [Caudoviricetes sp.]DAV63760.1 MAG TPA: hypothetical protein [Caudoviricetes sp.]
MTNDINLSSFPCDRIQGLAMIYTQNQDLKGKTPSDIAKIYVSAYHEIKSCIRSFDKEFRN